VNDDPYGEVTGPSDSDIEVEIAKAKAKNRGETLNRRERRLYSRGGRYSEYDREIQYRMTTKTKRKAK
jgi:HSP20 family molecular chaperone IbpA